MIPSHTAPALRTEGLRLAYRPDRIVIDDLDFTLPGGAVTAIVGANGSGKSTLLRALARLLAPTAGHVLLDGRDLHKMRTREVARSLGLLPQAPVTPEGITVRDLVRRGRLPHTSLFRQLSAEDETAIADALAATDLTELADEPVDTLSGGQRQRAWLALVVAQGTPLLLLDEPTTFLDLAHQLDVLELVRRLNRDEGRTVLMVLHDLNQACRFADHVVALREGAVVAAGRPDEVVTDELVEATFGVESRVVPDPVTGRPLVVPLGRS
ncbi:MAG: ATP-binding cassette domain-containing protein [Streptosporangiales bacterium]|nr:ATP-binding cassette domain-containing protein [Streptosporangiales bacterium]